jgi:hypothetical protein
MKHVSELYKAWKEYNAPDALMYHEGYYFAFGGLADDIYRKYAFDCVAGKTCGQSYVRIDDSRFAAKIAKTYKLVIIDDNQHCLEECNNAAKWCAAIIIGILIAAVVLGFILK